MPERSWMRPPNERPLGRRPELGWKRLHVLASKMLKYPCVIEEPSLRFTATLFDVEPMAAGYAVVVAEAHVPADALKVGERELRNPLVAVRSLLRHGSSSLAVRSIAGSAVPKL